MVHDLGLLRPGFVAGEPLAERPEAQAGDLVVDRLVDRGVDHEPVEAHRHLAIRGGLQRFGRERPGAAAGRERLGRHEVLAVDVRDGRRLADVGVELRAWPVRLRGPHRAHGDGGLGLDLHAVGDERAARFVRLGVARHAARRQEVGQLVVVILRGHLGQRLAEVPQEAVGGLGALHDAAGERGQPGLHVVAAPLRELGDHVVGPVRHAGFPAVRDDVLQAALAHQAAGRVLVLVEVVVEVRLHVALVELVHFEAGGFGRRGAVLRAGQRVADAKHHPVPGRRRPVERAVGAHLRRQVDDIGLADGIGRRNGRRRHRIDVGRRRERRLLLEPVDDRAVQDELGDLRPGRRRGSLRPPGRRPAAEAAHAAAPLGRLRLRRQDGDAEERARSTGANAMRARAGRNRRHHAELARRRRSTSSCWVGGGAAAAPAASAAAGGDEGHAADGLRLRQLELDPGPLAHRRGRQQRRLREVAVGEGGHVERAAARRHLGLHGAHRTVAVGRAIGDDRRVGIELGRRRRVLRPVPPNAPRPPAWF